MDESRLLSTAWSEQLDRFPLLQAALERRAAAAVALHHASQQRARDRRRLGTFDAARTAADLAELEVTACFTGELLPGLLGGSWRPCVLSPFAHRRVLDLTFSNYTLIGLPLYFRASTAKWPGSLTNIVMVGHSHRIFISGSDAVSASINQQARAAGAKFRVGFWARRDPGVLHPSLVICARGLHGRVGEAEEFGFVGLA